MSALWRRSNKQSWRYKNPPIISVMKLAHRRFNWCRGSVSDVSCRGRERERAPSRRSWWRQKEASVPANQRRLSCSSSPLLQWGRWAAGQAAVASEVRAAHSAHGNVGNTRQESARLSERVGSHRGGGAFRNNCPQVRLANERRQQVGSFGLRVPRRWA